MSDVSDKGRPQGSPVQCIRRLAGYARFVRLSHTLFSLPLLVAGTVLGAGGIPSARTLALALLAGAGARVAALALNRIVDRRIDAANPRTAARELPAGRMAPAEAWGVAAAGTAVFVGAAAALPPPCLALTPAPLAVFALYPFLKRWTSLCHFGVGVALSLAPLGGYLAAGGPIPPAPGIVALAAFTLLWAAGFDVIYATLDADHDRLAGLHSLPGRLGVRRALRVAAALHAAAFAALVVVVAQRGALGRAAAIGALAVVAALLVVEHVRAPSDVEFAFFEANVAVGAAVLALAAVIA